MIYENILFELTFDNKLRVLPGQGIPVKFIRHSKTERTIEDKGTVYCANLKDPKAGDFYMLLSPSLKLSMIRFARNKSDSKVTTFISSAANGETFETPEIKPAYVAPDIPGDLQIDNLVWKFLNATIALKKYALLLGPKGCGKSEVARRLAEANEMDFYEFDMGQAFKPKKYFLGGMIIGESGRTEQVHSQFFKAFTSERPTLIFLDELTRIPSVAANYLMTILSRNQSFIYDDDAAIRYEKGKDVVFVAAGNVGFSYSATNHLDSAFEDRFIKLKVDYMSKEQEMQLIRSRYPDLEVSLISDLTKASSLLREGERKGSLSVSLSTRQVLDAAAYCTLGFSLNDTLKDVILTNYIMSDEVKEAELILQSL